MKEIVGVLAIHGDFQAHISMLNEFGVDVKEIRTSNDIKGITRLIIPGGESTTINKIAKQNGLWDNISDFKGPVMGTCMGSVLMATEVESPSADSWKMMNFTVKRNAYGRQISSFTSQGKLKFSDDPFEMIFIRAPKFSLLGDNIEPIAWHGNEVTGLKSGNKLAFSFHPELSESPVIHEYFLALK